MGGGSERGEGFRRIDLAVDDIFVMSVGRCKVVSSKKN